MSSRRNFLRNSALLAASSALPMSKGYGENTGSSKSISPEHGCPPYKNTYIKNVFVTENEFRNAPRKIIASPGFDKAKGLLPQPFWKGNNQAIDMYWKAWEIAFRNIKDPNEKNRFISSYIDTAYNGNIFMWDSTFITMFARYGYRAYPFQHTLDNFYAKQHPDGFICREIWGDTGEDCFHRYDPTSTGPNLIPWSEFVFFKQYGDLDRIHKIFPVLCAYYQWLKLNHTWQDGSYWSSGWGTGMDNQPRLQAQYNPIFSNGHMTWIDTCLQQLFIGKILVDFGFLTERWQEIEDIEDDVKFLKRYIKEKMWDAKSSFLYDRYSDSTKGTLKSIGAFWALWTDVLEKKELEDFVKHLKDKETFFRHHPVPSMPANHPKYQADGRYWQGGVWAPTNYMVLAGLRNKGFDSLAFELAMKHHEQVLEVYKNTGTFWEYYAPEKTEPGFLARPDFIGWTGLVPISIMFEMIFGIQANLIDKTIGWNVRLTEEHGIEQYPFGKNGLISFRCNNRKNVNEKPSIVIHSNIEFTLKLRWSGSEQIIQIKTGENKI